MMPVSSNTHVKHQHTHYSPKAPVYGMMMVIKIRVNK